MMKAKARYPIQSLSGQVAGLKAGWHAKTIKKTGTIIIARNGSPYARYEPTEAQLANQRRFSEAVRERWRAAKLHDDHERSGN